MFDKLKALFASQTGATAIEYALIISLIFLAMVGAVSQVATKTNSMWGKVSNEVSKN